MPTFEEIEPDVNPEWITGHRTETKRKMFDAMRARYEVVLPAAVVGNAAGAGPPGKSP